MFFGKRPGNPTLSESGFYGSEGRQRRDLVFRSGGRELLEKPACLGSFDDAEQRGAGLRAPGAAREQPVLPA